MTTLCVLTPVFNDWVSFRILLGRLDDVAKTLAVSLFVIAVDDGSIDEANPALGDLSSLSALLGAEIVQLGVNVGHQRAIAVGLCTALDSYLFDAVVVMDADGEDPPERIPDLLERVAGRENFCVVAERRKRTETVVFKLSYIIYRSVFRVITGKRIRFGNFSLTSHSYVSRLVMTSELWNNFAAAILKSRLPVDTRSIDRGHRYAGSSKMNFVSLIVHGFSAISVYAETIFVRLLILSIFLVLSTLLATATVLLLRIFMPSHATPGWATTVSFGMATISAQVLLTTLSSLLMLLNTRVQRLIIPLLEYKPFIARRKVILGVTPPPNG